MGWSDKYKRSIDCNNPKGFSQKAHCAGRKIRKENMKLSELKEVIRDLIQERSINAISKAQQKNASDIEKALDFYKKNKNTDKAKAFIKVLKKLGEDKKKLAKEMDDKVASLYKNADYKGPIDESIELGKIYPNPYHTAFKSESQIKEEENSVNEMQVVNKKTGKDITRHVLDLLKGKIDKKKFEKLTGLKKESVNEEDDHEVGMGLSSLKSSVRSAKVIYDNIKKRNIEELDGWVQEKLTLASDYLKNVADYMEDLDEYDKDGTSNN